MTPKTGTVFVKGPCARPKRGGHRLMMAARGCHFKNDAIITDLP
jgi:hypothetical protein